MSENKPDTQAEQDLGLKLVYWLTVAMVVVGLINMTPGIPGYDDLAESLTGVKGITCNAPVEMSAQAIAASSRTTA